MRALPVVVLLLVTSASAAPRKWYLTDLGRRVLAKTDQIVEARVVAVRDAFRGITTAHLQVLERFDGFDRSKVIVLMYVDDLTAPDAFAAKLQRSTVKYSPTRRSGDKPKASNKNEEKAKGIKAGRRRGVRLAVGEEGLFFLRRKGASYQLLNLIQRADPLYKAKRERLAAIIKLENVPAAHLRTRRAKELFFATIADKDVWVRGNSSREVASLARQFPSLFNEAEKKRLVTLLKAERERPIQRSLELAVRALDPSAALAFAADAERKDRERFSERLRRERERIDKLKLPAIKASDIYRTGRNFGRAATGLVALYLVDPEAIVRERAAQTLAEFGGPSCRVALRDALSKETDVNVAGALVYACGFKRDPEAVALIAARLDDVKLEANAINALGRIGTREAHAALRKHRKKSTGAIAELIDSLLAQDTSGKK